MNYFRALLALVLLLMLFGWVTGQDSVIVISYWLLISLPMVRIGNLLLEFLRKKEKAMAVMAFLIIAMVFIGIAIGTSV